MSQIILASQSPRRKELLTQMGVEFEVMPSNFEEHLDNSRTPEEVAKELALGKARTIAERYPEAIVIGSDTIVTIEGKQLEKPTDAADAKYLLELLAGKVNYVTTGLAVLCLAQDFTACVADTVKVYFKPYDEAVVDAYIATGDPMDKAGAYGIQSGAAPLISRISGRGDTAIGLPTKLLADILSQLGVSSKRVDLTLPVPQD